MRIFTEAQYKRAVREEVRKAKWQENVNSEIGNLTAQIYEMRQFLKELCKEMDKPKGSVRGFYVMKDKTVEVER